MLLMIMGRYAEWKMRCEASRYRFEDARSVRVVRS